MVCSEPSERGFSIRIKLRVLLDHPANFVYRRIAQDMSHARKVRRQQPRVNPAIVRNLVMEPVERPQCDRAPEKGVGQVYIVPLHSTPL